TNGPINFTDTADLTVGTVNGTNGISTGNNPLTLSTNGSLVVNQPINTGGAAFVANTGATRAATDQVNVAITAGSATINGGNFPDQFIITPSATAPFTINGGPPFIQPGDNLTLNLPSGTLVTQFVITSSGPGASKDGFFTFNNLQALNFTSIEFIPQAHVTVFSFQDSVSHAQIVAQSVFNGQGTQGHIAIATSPPPAFFLAPNQTNPSNPFSAPNVALGDINGDGIDDVIVGSGSGSRPLVTVLNGTAILRIGNNQP